MTRTQKLGTTLVFLSMAVSGSMAFGQTPVTTCSPARLNGDCVIELDRDDPVVPLPVRMGKGKRLTVRVKKHIFDTVTFDATVTALAPPDPTSGLAALLTPLGQFVAGTGRIDGNPSPQPRLTNPNLELQPSAVTAILGEQESLLPKLEAHRVLAKSAADNLAKVRAISGGTNVEEARGRLDSAQVAMRALLEKPSLGGQVKALRMALDAVARESAASLVRNQTDLGTALSRQETLEEAAAKIESARVVIKAASETLGAEDFVWSKTLTSDTSFPRSTGNVSRHGLSTKVTIEDALSKKTKELGPVQATWNDSPWEFSVGSAFSPVPKREFKQAAIVSQGAPVLNDKDQPLTVVTETRTRPTAVPLALLNYRLGNWAPGGRRIAALLSGGAGVNAASGSTDFAAGATIGYRSLFVSALWHAGRDIRLLNGVTTGMQFGPSAPALATERFWTFRPAMAVTIKLP